MSERIPAPEDFADVDNMVLPARACLLALRDTALPARRAALADASSAIAKADRVRRPRDEVSALALALMWETVACLELAAQVAAPWVDPQIQSEHGAWAELTVYDPSRANRFYESSHNWTDERFGTLSSHSFRHGQEGSWRDAMREHGMLPSAKEAAFVEAEAATAAFLRRRFAVLARSWSAMRTYAAAYEHGLLLVPDAIGSVVDSEGTEISHALIVFESRKDSSRGEVGDSVDEAVAAAKQAGDLALDVAEHVIGSRIGIIEALEFDGDQIYLKTWNNAFPYWFERGDVSEETLAELGDEFHIGFQAE